MQTKKRLDKIMEFRILPLVNSDRTINEIAKELDMYYSACYETTMSLIKDGYLTKEKINKFSKYRRKKRALFLTDKGKDVLKAFLNLRTLL